MIISLIIIIISILLDGIISNYLPYLYTNLSIFTPLLTLVSIFMIYPFFKKKERNYFIIIFIVGIIYDLLYTNLLFFNGVLFVVIGLLIKYIYKTYEITPLRLILYIIILVISYESLTGIILLIYNVVEVTFYKVFYKIINSLLLNIIYSELIYLVIRLLPSKYKKISIN
ncbi:MAG: rod shape-determining protein MreD [Bacilli bacterium]|nr:rod shape-determining protein MreD [Bacilli bacterium]